MFEVCALWIVKLIQGEMTALPDKVRYHLIAICLMSAWFYFSGKYGSGLGQVGCEERDPAERLRGYRLPDRLRSRHCQVGQDTFICSIVIQILVKKITWIKSGIADLTFPGTWTSAQCSRLEKLRIFSITITVDITLAITRSGTITEKRISSHTETRASLQSLQVQKNVISCSSISRDLCWLPDLLIHSTYSTKLSCLISISITSFFPGTQSPIHHTNFMYALDDSLDTFMHQTKKWKLKTTMTMTITKTKLQVNGMEE